jgi:hypothetical protein
MHFDFRSLARQLHEKERELAFSGFDHVVAFVGIANTFSKARRM